MLVIRGCWRAMPPCALLILFRPPLSAPRLQCRLGHAELGRDSIPVGRVGKPRLVHACATHAPFRSAHTACPALQVHRQLEDRGVRLASAQVQLSLLSWGPQQHELVATARELGVTVIAYSPLGLGMLTGAAHFPHTARCVCFVCYACCVLAAS